MLEHTLEWCGLEGCEIGVDCFSLERGVVIVVAPSLHGHGRLIGRHDGSENDFDCRLVSRVDRLACLEDGKTTVDVRIDSYSYSRARARVC